MSRYDPDRHHRRSIRLKEYDYSQAGAYFVTFVTHGRQCLFGHVDDDGIMHHNEWGMIVAECWMDIPRHFPHVTLDEWVVMPNHVHGILVFHATGDGGGRAAGGGGRRGMGDGGAPPWGEASAAITNHGSNERGGADASPLHPDPVVGRDAVDRDTSGSGMADREHHAGPTPGPHLPGHTPGHPIGTRPGSVGAVIQNVKSVSTRRIRAQVRRRGEASASPQPPDNTTEIAADASPSPQPPDNTTEIAADASPSPQPPNAPYAIWQRNYHDHVIRDPDSLDRIRRYIRDNPRQWAVDMENPERMLA